MVIVISNVNRKHSHRLCKICCNITFSLQEWALTKDHSIKHLDVCLTLIDATPGSALKLYPCTHSNSLQVCLSATLSCLISQPKSYCIATMLLVLLFYNNLNFNCQIVTYKYDWTWYICTKFEIYILN